MGLDEEINITWEEVANSIKKVVIRGGQRAIK